MLWIAAKSLLSAATPATSSSIPAPPPAAYAVVPPSELGWLLCLSPSRASITAAPAAEMASNKRSRADSSGGGGGRFLRSTGTDGLVCSVCEDDIPYEGKHAELMPCECSLCHECLLEAHAERGSSPALCCPDHGVEVEAHQLFERRLVVKTTNYNLEKKTMGAKETMMKSARQYLWQEKGDVLKVTPVNEEAQIAVLCFAQLTKSAGEMKLNWSAVERSIARTGKRKLADEDGTNILKMNRYQSVPEYTKK